MTLEQMLKIEEEFIVVQKAFIEAREQYEALSQLLRKAEREYIRGVLAVDIYVERDQGVALCPQCTHLNNCVGKRLTHPLYECGSFEIKYFKESKQ